MSGVVTLILVVGIVLVIAVIVVVTVIVVKRGRGGPVPIPDPPYNRAGVVDPTENDPQVVDAVHPDDVRHVDGPDNIRNPDIDRPRPGPSAPRTFQPPGPPRQ